MKLPTLCDDAAERPRATPLCRRDHRRRRQTKGVVLSHCLFAFLDLAQTCAQWLRPETLAGSSVLKSRFEPLAIRITAAPNFRSSRDRGGSDEIATSLVAKRQDIQLVSVVLDGGNSGT